MTLTSLPEKRKKGYRIQIKMHDGWKNSLTWSKIYSQREAEDLVRSMNDTHPNAWRAVRVEE